MEDKDFKLVEILTEFYFKGVFDNMFHSMLLLDDVEYGMVPDFYTIHITYHNKNFIMQREITVNLPVPLVSNLREQLEDL